jgi:hypothetical protein
MYHDHPKLPPWRYELSRLADVSRAQGLLLGWLADVVIALSDEGSVGDRDDAAPLHRMSSRSAVCSMKSSRSPSA